MRQLLMLGFYCEVYRREPLCRIYVNNRFLDEFNIPHISKKDIDYTNLFLNPAYTNNDYIEIEFNSLFYKFIEFDHEDKEPLDIRIEIVNNDNNYANGFMTRCTVINLSQFYVVPIKVLNSFDSLRDRWKFSLANWNNSHGKTKSVTYYHSGSRNIIENFAVSLNMNFPDIIQVPMSRDENEKYQNLPLVWVNDPKKSWIGSDGYFQLTLKKKLGFWQHASDPRKGYRRFNYNVVVKKLYDKYKQYEDTRSTDT